MSAAEIFPKDHADDAALRESTWRFLRGLGCDPAAADDLTQEAFLRAAEHAANGLPTRAWLFTVARNLFVDRCRRAGREVSVPWTRAVEAELVACLDAESESAWVEAARLCVTALAPKAARIVTMFYREDRSREEIATALGMTEAGVKTALQRARAQLKSCIEARIQCESPKTTCSTRS